MSDAGVIHQAYRFALDPSIEQEQFLAGCAGASRFWFNQDERSPVKREASQDASQRGDALALVP